MGGQRVVLGLGALLVVLLLAIGVTTLVRDDGADDLTRAAAPWLAGDDLTDAHREVAAAAEKETLAFLEVDYRDMEPLMQAVLDGATGDFAKQYAERQELLVEQAEKNKSVSSGKVVALGVGELDDDSALVYVAADSQVQNVNTGGTAQPRYYRLQLDLVREGDRWLTSNVQFVG